LAKIVKTLKILQELQTSCDSPAVEKFQFVPGKSLSDEDDVLELQRGELFHDVPVGYIRGDDGLPQLDPDVTAQHVMKMFFELFQSLGSSNALFQHLAAHNIKLPSRTRGGPIKWRLEARTTVYGLLKHPFYAGAYGYGRRKNY
jgi:Recombinase